MMNRQLGWTTIEQSKRLVEAGLNPDTADMFYIFDPFVQDIAGLGIGKPEETGDIPCWSFGTLINLMPKYLTFGKEHFDLVIIPWLNQVQYINIAINSTKERTYMESRMEKTLIDSVVSMIERLLACKSTYLVKVKSGLI